MWEMLALCGQQFNIISFWLLLPQTAPKFSGLKWYFCSVLRFGQDSTGKAHVALRGVGWDGSKSGTGIIEGSLTRMSV